MDTSKFDAPTKKFYKLHPLYFNPIVLKDRDWWLYDRDIPRWVVAEYISHDTETYKVTLKMGNKVYTVPIYRLFMDSPDINSIATRQDEINIAGGKVMVKSDLKF